MNTGTCFYKDKLTSKYLIWLGETILLKAIVLKTLLSVHAMLIPAIKLVTPGDRGLMKWRDDMILDGEGKHSTVSTGTYVFVSGKGRIGKGGMALLTLPVSRMKTLICFSVWFLWHNIANEYTIENYIFIYTNILTLHLDCK